MSHPEIRLHKPVESIQWRRRHRCLAWTIGFICTACSNVGTFTYKVLSAVCFVLPVAIITFGILSGRFEHDEIDGKVQRAWHVMLPGYKSYTDWDVEGKPVIRYSFSISAPYRVGPWIDPVWAAK